MPTETIPFEILGHFEEIIDIESGKCYGTRSAFYSLDQENRGFETLIFGMMLPEPPPYGYAGRVERLFKKDETVQIDKAHKGMQNFKFKKDARCWIITHPICGRMK